MKRIFIVIIFLSFCSNLITAQRFGGGLLAGMNLAQIDGDLIFGFNKFGLNSGVFGTAKLSKNMDLMIQLKYSQRGSHYGKNDILQVKYNLNYIEVPVLYTLKDWNNDKAEKPYYRMEFHGGLSLGRLISSTSANGLDEKFKKTDISWAAGFSYYFQYRLGFTGMYVRSFTPLYRYDNKGVDTKMISYFISLGIIYRLN